MPRPRNPLPTYRRHAPTGQAVCTVRLADGRRQDLYLGRYNSAASRTEFHRVVAVVADNGGVYPASPVDLTIAECLVRYVAYIDGYYRHPDGTPTGTADDIKVTLGYLKRLFPTCRVAEFGVPELKAVRDAMVADGRVRNQVNRRVSMVRSFVRWCVEERLAPAVVLTELKAVRPLAAGRGGVREGPARGPADPMAVEAVLPHLPPAPRAVVALLRLTGARPSEVLSLRPCDVDRSGAVWAFTPARHKSSWRGRPRVIQLGPGAQAILAPWLAGCRADEPVFSPRRSEQARADARRPGRSTPRAAARGKDRYTARLLAQALRRACRRAGVPGMSPYQLRHLRATELRAAYGLETVRAVLGHTFQAMSDHYSKAADAGLAARAMSEAG